MNETTNNCRASRAHNPFDDGARERLRRMELLTETGSIKASALIALAHTFAGLLFDDLCDASQDYSGVQTELQQLFDAVDRAEPRQKFLLLCLQYDRLSQVLPDPIWWNTLLPSSSGFITPCTVEKVPFSRGFSNFLDSIVCPPVPSGSGQKL